MARKQVASYAAVAMHDKEPEDPQPKPPREPQGNTALLRDVAAHIMVYIHPDAAKELATYAVAQSGHRSKVRVHDLVIEALEDWFRKKGLRSQVRAKPKDQPGRAGGSK